LFVALVWTGSLSAQTISKEEMIFLTSEWKGERFADGRLKIPDELLERAKHIMIDDAGNALRNEGYVNQYEGGWKMVNETLMTGRAVTAMYMPSIGGICMTPAQIMSLVTTFVSRSIFRRIFSPNNLHTPLYWSVF